MAVKVNFFKVSSSILLIIWLCSQGSGYRILMLPANVNSHIIYIGRMGQGLAKLGHQVKMPVAENAKIPWDLANENFTIIPFEVTDDVSIFSGRGASEVYLDYALSENKILEYFRFGIWLFNDCANALGRNCESLLESKKVMNELVNETKFDFVITDFPQTECFMAIIKILNVPYGVLTIPTLPWNNGIPRFPSFFSNYFLPFTDNLTFFQRMCGLFTELSTYFAIGITSTPSNIPDYLPYRSKRSYNMLDGIKNASLHFYLEDLAIGYPRPNMPDVVSIGDISSGIPGLPIPYEIEKFIDNSDAILVSFGSFFEFLSDSLALKFCETFKMLQHFKIIWKLNNATVCGPSNSNLLVLPWIPQNDLLADKRIKLFVTHGGFNSVIESIYHETPVIVIPLSGDQPSLAQIAVEKGYGKHVDLRYWNPEGLTSTIKEVLDNPTYTERAKHFSNILRSKHDTAAERASNAISDVIRFGTDHLRSSARNLYWFQFMMFDLFIVLVAILMLLFGVLLYILFKLLKFVVSKVSPRTTKAKKE